MIIAAFTCLIPPRKRYGLALQRRNADAAETLLSDNTPEQYAFSGRSRTHSRGYAAAVHAYQSPGARNGGASAPGIDMEYVDPVRRWSAILARYAGDAAVRNASPQRLCRAWTFVEAHYKAFGGYADTALVADTLRDDDADDTPLPYAPDIWRYHHQVSPEFWLSLVWRGDGVQPVILNGGLIQQP